MVDRRHNLVISGQALVPKTHGLTIAWVMRALSGSFTLTDSTTDPSRNGTFAEPLPASSYVSSSANPFNVDFDGGRNGATGPGLFQTDLRLEYPAASGHGTKPRCLRRRVQRDESGRRFDNPTGDRRSTDFLNLTIPARRRRAHDRADRCAHAVLTPLVESRMRLMVP